MANSVYFDTDVFHRVGKTFATQRMAADLCERILLSPLTILEALSHLTLKNNADAIYQLLAEPAMLSAKRCQAVGEARGWFPLPRCPIIR
jgi:hypothetical protein